MSDKTPEQLAAEAAKAAEAETKKQAKAQKEADAAQKKKDREDAKAKKDAEKAEKLAAAEAKKQAKAAEAAAKPVKDTQNGVSRPTAGVTQLIWIHADQMSATLERAVKRPELVEALKAIKIGENKDQEINVGTIHTQYGRWRKYYGLSETKEERAARIATNKAAKEAAAAQKKADKEAADKKAAEASAQAAAASGQAPAAPGETPEPPTA